MSQLYTMENGVLIPYNVANILQNPLPNRTEAAQYGGVASAAQSNAVSTQKETVQPSNEQPQPSSVPTTQQNNAQQSSQVGATNDKAYQELYMQAMADLENQRAINAQLQVEMAKNAILGAANQEVAVDLDGAFDKFFGYTE